MPRRQACIAEVAEIAILHHFGPIMNDIHISQLQKLLETRNTFSYVSLGFWRTPF